MIQNLRTLRRFNQKLPPWLSYYARRAVYHPSVLRFKTYSDYYRARLEEADVNLDKSLERALVRRWAEDAIATGHPEVLLDGRDTIPDAAWYDPRLRLQYTIALTSLGRYAEACAFAKETLFLGAHNDSTLLRTLGDIYLFGDAQLARDCAYTLFLHHGNVLTTSQRIYVINNMLNHYGETVTLGLGGVGAPKPGFDSYVFQSNLALAAKDFANQLNGLNKAFALVDMPLPLRVKDASAPVSVTNLESQSPQTQIRGPLVSVMMSTFNAERTLIPILRSLSAQTYADIEILVVDDCSSDNSFALAEAYARNTDPRVRVFKMEKNGGTYRARNRGLLEARGEFFTCNDSDDWAYPTKIAELVSPLKRNDKLIASIGSLVRLSSQFGVKPKPNGYLHEDLSSLLYRRAAVVERIGFYEPVAFGADSEFSSRLSLAFRDRSIEKIPKPLLIADWSRKSLTGALTTGITDGGTMAPQRRQYQTAFRERHVSGALFVGLESAGASLAQPAAG